MWFITLLLKNKAHYTIVLEWGSFKNSSYTAKFIWLTMKSITKSFLVRFIEILAAFFFSQNFILKSNNFLYNMTQLRQLRTFSFIVLESISSEQWEPIYDFNLTNFVEKTRNLVNGHELNPRQERVVQDLQINDFKHREVIVYINIYSTWYV